MKIVIVGCGRVGASAAELLGRRRPRGRRSWTSRRGAFERLPSEFGGTAIRGDGTDEDVLRRAGAEGADVFLALTEGDNRNIMATQVAAEALGIPSVIAKINDPLRATAYSEIGHRDALSHRVDGGRAQRVHRVAAVRADRPAGFAGASPPRQRPRRRSRARSRSESAPGAVVEA